MGNDRVGPYDIGAYEYTSPCAIATGTISACNAAASSVNFDGTGGWKDILDASGNLIASIENTQNLGLVSCEYYRHPDGNRIDGASQNYLGRNIKINVSNQPASPVKVRLCFLATEYAALQAATNTVKTTTALSDLEIAKFPTTMCNNSSSLAGAGVAVPNQAQANILDGHFLETSVSNFSEFYIHEAGGVLPVDLLYFMAETTEQQSVALNWVTASEQNNSHFEVERSQDGKSFESIGKVQGAGDSQRVVHYDFLDTKPHKGVNYYRLKQVDFDGAFEYSEIRTVYLKSAVDQVGEFYPNPSKSGFVQLDYFASNAGQLNIAVLDISGRTLVESTQIVAEGQQSLNFDFSILQSGLYFVQLQQAAHVSLRKLVME